MTEGGTSANGRSSFVVSAETVIFAAVTHITREVMRAKGRVKGCSYAYRVQDIVRIYDEHAKSGLSNREILRRYIWPKYHISERAFYYAINASVDPRVTAKIEEMNRQLSLF